MAHLRNGLCLARSAGECSCPSARADCFSTGAYTHEGEYDECCCPEVSAVLVNRERLASTLSGWLQPADVEDLIQEACIRALTSPVEFRGRASTFAWLRRLLRNLAIDHIRHEGAEARARAGFARDRLARGLATSELVDTRASSEALALLDEIEPAYADVVRRVDLEEASIDDVASELGLTKGNVRVRLHRARAKLRERWSERGGS